MNCYGKVNVYRKDFENGTAYSFSVSTKKQDGSFDTGYMKLQFKKGVELQDKTKIDIKDAWLKTYNKNIYLFVNEFEAEDLPSGFEQTTITDDEMPF